MKNSDSRAGGAVEKVETKEGKRIHLTINPTVMKALHNLSLCMPCVVGLDTLANCSILKDEILVEGVTRNEEYLPIQGIENGEGFNPEYEAYFSEFDLRVYYDERSPANILAFSDVRETLNIDFDNDLNQFTVYNYPYKRVFEAIGKVYICDFSQPSKYVMYRTVQEAESLFSPKEVERARKVREFQIARGLASDSEMIRTIKAGSIAGSPYLVQDVQLARQIYGPDIASLRGKSKRKPPPALDHQSFAVQPVRVLQWLYMDLFFTCGLAFLVSISKPLDLIKVSFLREGKKLPGVLKAVLSHLSSYKAHMFVVAGVRTDGESAIVNIRTEIEQEGVKLDIASKGEKVGIIENKIGRIKERVRGVTSLMPFKLTSLLLIGLVFFVVIRLNQSIFSKIPGEMSPFSNFHLRQVDLKTDYGIRNGEVLSFGDYVEANNIMSVTNGIESRTEGCIALYPTGNENGSWRFLNLKTNKFITRHQWTALPTPWSVIQRINLLAAQERTPIPRDPVFQYRQREVLINFEDDFVEELPLPLMRDPDEVGEDVRDAAARQHEAMEKAEFNPEDISRKNRSKKMPETRPDQVPLPRRSTER
jgi:hypothetical protein